MKFIKSFIKNHSTQITSFALAMAVIITNMNCWGKAFQEKLPEGRKFFARFDYYFHMRCFFWNPHRGIGFLDSFICAENVYWWISCQDPAKVSVYFVDSDHNFFLDYKNGYE